MVIDEIERERRREAVAAEIASLVLDGGKRSAKRLARLQGYVDGQVSIEELRVELIERMRQDKWGIADEDEMRRAWGDPECLEAFTASRLKPNERAPSPKAPFGRIIWEHRSDA